MNENFAVSNTKRTLCTVIIYLIGSPNGSIPTLILELLVPCQLLFIKIVIFVKSSYSNEI
ncbi:hypothetical protein DERF_015943 [Dermatophagoides farinae]|uniref:Uncharacterized protein n=1 Tax=Dermatophagoides farinae TaxID=6954 RepID=A0A922HFS9_DERFA|nr:hypothetical protein DERF_015943 [Dermatophagoides farinae]